MLCEGIFQTLTYPSLTSKERKRIQTELLDDLEADIRRVFPEKHGYRYHRKKTWFGWQQTLLVERGMLIGFEVVSSTPSQEPNTIRLGCRFENPLFRKLEQAAIWLAFIPGAVFRYVGPELGFMQGVGDPTIFAAIQFGLFGWLPSVFALTLLSLPLAGTLRFILMSRRIRDEMDARLARLLFRGDSEKADDIKLACWKIGIR